MKADKIVKLIISILVVIIAGGAGSFVLKNKIEESGNKIYESRSMLKVLENRDENYSLLKADYPIVQEGLPLLRKVLPGEEGLNDILTGLDALANETNNTQSLVFDPLSAAQNIGGMRSINFSGTLEGNFLSFGNYFKKMKLLPYFIEVGSIGVANGAGIFTDNNSRLTFKAKLYIKN